MDLWFHPEGSLKSHPTSTTQKQPASLCDDGEDLTDEQFREGMQQIFHPEQNLGQEDATLSSSRVASRTSPPNVDVFFDEMIHSKESCPAHREDHSSETKLHERINAVDQKRRASDLARINENDSAQVRFWSIFKSSLRAYYDCQSKKQSALGHDDSAVAAMAFEAFADQLHHVKEMSEFSPTPACPASHEDETKNLHLGKREKPNEPFSLKSFLREGFQQHMPDELKVLEAAPACDGKLKMKLPLSSFLKCQQLSEMSYPTLVQDISKSSGWSDGFEVFDVSLTRKS